MKQALTFKNQAKSYGKQTVLSDIDFDVREGEFFGLVGLNGTGKTTLIKCLLDFCTVNIGSISIFGLDHRKTSARDKLIFLPEKFKPPYYLTGEDFLKYMAELHGTTYDNDRVDKLLKILDLNHAALKKPVHQYSKGMGQKLGLCACLQSNKELFVFDEPMSGLDPKARANLKNYLLEQKQNGKALFFSTHLLMDVESLCDRLAILHGGAICFIGTPSECCRKYNTTDLEHAYLQCINNTPEH